MSDTPIEPLVLELAAVRLFCGQQEDTHPAASKAECESMWRGLEPAAREGFRVRATNIINALNEDGVTLRASRNAAAALKQVVTVPAHVAYTIPGYDV